MGVNWEVPVFMNFIQGKWFYRFRNDANGPRLFQTVKSLNSSVCNFRKIELRKFPQKLCHEYYVSDMEYYLLHKGKLQRDFRLPPPCQWDLRCSGILRSVEWLFVADVSGQPLGPIFKCQTALGTAWKLMLGPIGFTETSVTTILRRVKSEGGPISENVRFKLCFFV
jgi:hypothetical protein